MRPKPIIKVAEFTGIPAYGWYLCDDGNIWYANVRLVSNEGTPEAFAHMANNLRLGWLPGFPDQLVHKEEQV